MVQYLAKRIGRSLLTLFIIVTLVFCLLRLMPVEGYFANYEKMTAAQIQAGLQSMGLLDPLPARGDPSSVTASTGPKDSPRKRRAVPAGSPLVAERKMTEGWAP